MARGLKEHQARQDAIAGLGRPLARRARSRCELCESGGVPLRVVEVEPLPEEPEVDAAVLICHRCREGMQGGPADPGEWRFLEAVAWSETPPVQVAAVRMLRRFSREGQSWASDVLDGLYLAPEIDAWLGEA